MHKQNAERYGSIIRRLAGASQTIGETSPMPVQNASFPVTITVHADKSLGVLEAIWRFFGADEPNYATMPDGEKLLADLGELSPQNVYFRAHNLMTTGDGTPAFKWGSTNMYTEDAQGNPVYDWKIVDALFETYLARGVRPYVQMGFMPEALSTQPTPYQHAWTPRAKYEEIYTGWAYPPKDYQKWGELCYEWAHHCVQKWGEAEVQAWYWQVWNEPNIGYFQGTPEEFRKLHDYAAAGVRRALPTAQIGGCDTAGGGPFLRDFLTHTLTEPNAATGKIDPPLDFVSFHSKGNPKFIAAKHDAPGYVQMGMAAQLKTIDDTFALIAAFPDYAQTPVIIGESDPDGCAACQGPQLAYRNTTMYSSYTVASFARKHESAARHGINLKGALTWAFEFENQPLFAGFRVLSTQGNIALPVLNAHRLMAKMHGRRVWAESDAMISLDAVLQNGVRSAPDVGVLASRSESNQLFVLLWHYHDDDLPGPPAQISLQLSGFVQNRRDSVQISGYRIDETHANAHAAWLQMNAPQTPTPAQTAALHEAAALRPDPGLEQRLPVSDGVAAVSLILPRQGIVLLIAE